MTSESGINALIEAHLGKIRLLARLVGRPPGIDIDDLWHEGILGAIQAAERYDPQKGPFWKFARHRIWGAMIDYARKLREIPEPYPEPVFAGASPERSAMDAERRLLVEKAICRLTKAQRAVIRLRGKGLKSVEIARALKIAESTARVLHHAALKRLRDDLVA
jgi:RNA polymerase sigma factor (sigma-70 family)